MKFELIPTLKIMEKIYSLPIGNERFNLYLGTLQGSSKSELKLPIAGFNPMAKSEVKDLINELIEHKIEDKIEEQLKFFQTNQNLDSSISIGVALNITDDLGGAWSEKYTTDFKNRFKNESILQRNFCVLTVFTSEKITEELILKRLKTSLLRCIYQLENGFPKTLLDHILQERQAFSNSEIEHGLLNKAESSNFIEKYKSSTSYNHIFYYFYGKEVCDALNYPSF